MKRKVRVPRDERKRKVRVPRHERRGPVQRKHPVALQEVYHHSRRAPELLNAPVKRLLGRLSCGFFLTQRSGQPVALSAELFDLTTMPIFLKFENVAVAALFDLEL